MEKEFRGPVLVTEDISNSHLCKYKYISFIKMGILLFTKVMCYPSSDTGSIIPELLEDTSFFHKDNFKFHTSQSDRVFRPSETERTEP